VDPKVLGLDVLIDRSEPGGSWASNGSPPVRWWTQSGGDDMHWSNGRNCDIELFI